MNKGHENMIHETHFLNGRIIQYELELGTKMEMRIIIGTEKTLPSHGISRIRGWAYYTNSIPTMRRLKKAYEHREEVVCKIYKKDEEYNLVDVYVNVEKEGIE